MIVTLITYISYLNLITGKYKLNAVTSSQLPQVDNRPFPHKMTFRILASLVQSRWLKHGYVCLSPPVLREEMDLTIFIDTNPNPGPPNCLSCLYLNARSLKAFDLFHLVLIHLSRSVRSPSFRTWYTLVSYDLVCICETWLNDTMLSSELIPGYSIFRRDRACKAGGGVLIAVKSDLQAIRSDDLERDNTEMVPVEIFTSSKSLILYTFYRPTDSNNVDLLRPTKFIFEGQL